MYIGSRGPSLGETRKDGSRECTRHGGEQKEHSTHTEKKGSWRTVGLRYVAQTPAGRTQSARGKTVKGRH